MPKTILGTLASMAVVVTGISSTIVETTAAIRGRASLMYRPRAMRAA
jgi:hypothetical protein